MRLLTTKGIKNLILSGAIAISFFLSGCSSDSDELSNLDNVSQQISSVQDTSSSEELNNESVSSEVLSYNELVSSLNSGNIPNYVLKATVDRVVDGDTVKLKFDDGNTESLRILLIDTPEDTKEKQYLGDVATSFAKEKLKAGDIVYVETDGNKTDKYGRYLGYLWYDENGNNDYKMYNEEVVREGLARVGYIYDAVRHLDKMKSAQYEAQQSKKNIWAIDGYVTDKGFDQSLAPTLNGSSNESNNSKSSNTDSEVVYVNTSSKKYHTSSDAHGMKSSTKMTESKAQKSGYTACKTCYK